ncbi:MAG: carboxypeptidase regulatory-like domain-containing protein [Pirellulaceae bacterium]
MRHSAKWLFLATLTVGFCGCGPAERSTTQERSAVASTTKQATTDETAASEPHTPNPRPSSSANANTADLSGRITLSGDRPPPRKLSITKDDQVCGAVDTRVDVEGIDGGVANVVIEIKGVEGENFQYVDPPAGYVIRQKDCQFTPSLIVVPNGKDIQVFNDDPVGHNVNTGAWNQMQPPGKQPIVKPVEGQSPIKIVCHIHSWMEGWIYPVQNPYFAVTDEKGDFNISGVPPGKYRISIWHPSLGRETVRLTLEAGQAAMLDHAYEAK